MFYCIPCDIKMTAIKNENRESQKFGYMCKSTCSSVVHLVIAGSDIHIYRGCMTCQNRSLRESPTPSIISSSSMTGHKTGNDGVFLWKRVMIHCVKGRTAKKRFSFKCWILELWTKSREGLRNYIIKISFLKRCQIPRFISFWIFPTNSAEFRKTCDVIHSHSEKIIRDRRQLIASERPGSRPVDFLDILLSGRVRHKQGTLVYINILVQVVMDSV